MQSVKLLLLAIILAPSLALAQFDKGFDFRATIGYVTDPTNYTYVISDAYPTTRNGVTFGWSNLNIGSCLNSIAGSDRDSTNAAQLAGINYAQPSETCFFQIDLPNPGTYTVRLALGDANGGYNPIKIDFTDNGSSLYAFTSSTSGAQTFLDANNIEWTNVTWPGSNTTKNLIFSTSTAIIKIGCLTCTYTTLASLEFIEVPSGTVPHRTQIMWNYPHTNETSFEIHRNAKDGPAGVYSLLATVPNTVTSYTVDRDTYCYKVRACNEGGCSNLSDYACEGYPNLPGQPSILSIGG